MNSAEKKPYLSPKLSKCCFDGVDVIACSEEPNTPNRLPLARALNPHEIIITDEDLFY